MQQMITTIRRLKRHAKYIGLKGVNSLKAFKHYY